jgi:hypothetical protein
MNPLEESVLSVRKRLHSENSCKTGMLHFDFYRKKEVSASFTITYFLDLLSLDERNVKISRDSFVVGYAPSESPPCKTRLLSHMAGVYLLSLLEQSDFEQKRVYLSGEFFVDLCYSLPDGIKKFNLEAVVDSDIDKLFIPARKRELKIVTASELE